MLEAEIHIGSFCHVCDEVIFENFVIDHLCLMMICNFKFPTFSNA